MDHQKSSGYKETGKTLIYAALIAMVIRTVAYEPFNIPSGSMIPTLLIGDYLFVSKFSYGYSRYSLPFGLPLIPGRIFFTEPERGDVMVFKLPTDNKTDYIKRIVGLPGDTVQLKDSILHINGTPVKRERVDDFVRRAGPGNYARTARYIETLPGGRRHYILELTDDTKFDNTPVFTVPEGHYFAMGDNRDRSRDSRFLDDVGYIPRENLVGRAEFLFFSVDGSVWEIWKWAS
ncbi:MAG: signal peptidase I, partial [Rhodospirillales bacterium]